MIQSGRGRVLALDADGCWLTLFIDGRLTSVQLAAGHARCKPGDLVRLDPAADGSVAVEVVYDHPTGEYPAPGSDALRFDAARWRRLSRRAELISSTREFFRARGFLEVETPLLVRSAGTEVHLDAVEASLHAAPGAARETRYLITSPELHMKRLLAAGAPPIFSVSKVFRDGERGCHHRPEFTMLEWYRPWSDYTALMDDCEAWFCALAEGASTLDWQGRSFDLRPPWPRVPFLSALEERAGIVEPERLDPEAQLRALVERVEPTLGEQGPEFLTHYPIAMASLARPCPQAPTLAERFELYLGGLELANGFGELTDAGEQRRRSSAENAERVQLGKPAYPLDEAFLSALNQGLPPSAGIAAGLDRVVMLFADAGDIDDVLAFGD